MARKQGPDTMDDPEESRTTVADTAADAALTETRTRKGAALVEYALILSLVSLMVVGTLALVSDSVNDVLVSVTNGIAGVASDNGNSSGSNSTSSGGGNQGGSTSGGQDCGSTSGGSQSGGQDCGSTGGGNGNSP